MESGYREQKPFFILLDGPKAHDSSGRDGKGEGDASMDSGYMEQKTFFVILGELKAHGSSGRDD